MPKDEEFVLIQWKSRGYEAEKHYTLHRCDVERDLIASNPILELIVPFEQRHRYAPYVRGFTSLIVYAVATGMFSKQYGNKIKITIDRLDRIFKRFLKDYNLATFDSDTIAAPEIGMVIKGRIKNE